MNYYVSFQDHLRQGHGPRPGQVVSHELDNQSLLCITEQP